MPKVSEKSKVLSKFDGLEEGLRKHFSLLPELINNISSPEPALAYCFQKIEMAQRAGLYALLMREYRTNPNLAWQAVDKTDITRSNFSEIYHDISVNKLPANLRDQIKPAETIRDRIIHGRECTTSQIFKAIVICLTYTEKLNDAFYQNDGFRPAGPLIGVTGRKGKQTLDARTTTAVLKGLGFKL